MSSLDLSLHWWRGIGPARGPCLFRLRWRVGFFTFSICRVCLLDRYRKLRRTIDDAVAMAEAGGDAAAERKAGAAVKPLPSTRSRGQTS